MFELGFVVAVGGVFWIIWFWENMRKYSTARTIWLTVPLNFFFWPICMGVYFYALHRGRENLF